MIEVRFHGRGGQGAKVASRILGRAGFLMGSQAQDFAIFGAERRGAPVVSFTRISQTPIERRGYIDAPDLVVVMDDSLLTEARMQVFQGVHANTPLFVNSAAASIEQLPEASFIFIDLTAIALRLMGHAFVSAAAAGVAAKSVSWISPAALSEAVRIEIAEFGLDRELIEKNEAAAREAYDAAPKASLKLVKLTAPTKEVVLESLPYLMSPQCIGPTMRRPGSAALRHTGNWRTDRPEIELAKCKRCFLCYLYCPDAAIALDRDNFPHIDYDHCKGCMICRQECPTDAITQRMEI